MLRKVRQVISSFPLLPTTSEDRKHSGPKNSNQNCLMLLRIYCSHQQRSLFQIRSQTKARTLIFSMHSQHLGAQKEDSTAFHWLFQSNEQTRVQPSKGRTNHNLFPLSNGPRTRKESIKKCTSQPTTLYVCSVTDIHT